MFRCREALEGKHVSGGTSEGHQGEQGSQKGILSALAQFGHWGYDIRAEVGRGIESSREDFKVIRITFLNASLH